MKRKDGEMYENLSVQARGLAHKAWERVLRPQDRRDLHFYSFVCGYAVGMTQMASALDDISDREAFGDEAS